jgi:hypothetical protein
MGITQTRLEYDTNTATNSSSTDPIRPPSAGGFAAASACEGRQVAVLFAAGRIPDITRHRSAHPGRPQTRPSRD